MPEVAEGLDATPSARSEGTSSLPSIGGRKIKSLQRLQEFFERVEALLTPPDPIEPASGPEKDAREQPAVSSRQ